MQRYLTAVHVLLSSNAFVCSLHKFRSLLTFWFCMQSPDLMHSQVCWIMMSSFQCQVRIICCKCLGSSSGPKGAQGRLRSWHDSARRAQGYYRADIPVVIRLPLPHTHTSSISQRGLLPIHRRSSHSLAWFYCLSPCVPAKCCSLQTVCLCLFPFVSPSAPWPLQYVSLMTDGPAPSPGSVIPNKKNKLTLHSCQWDFTIQKTRIENGRESRETLASGQRLWRTRVKAKRQ